MYENEMELAVQATKEAGNYLRKRQDINIQDFSGKDLKLSSDKKSEKIILDYLSQSSYPVLSEECGIIGGNNKLRWIVDPIDGTVNYFKGMDELSCVSLALWDSEKNYPVLGVINRFMRNELFTGSKGTGAFLNGAKIKPSNIKRTEDAVMATGFPVKRNYSTDSLLPFVQQVQHFKKVRMLGTAALMGVFVAAGRVDAYFEDEIMIWDIAAAMAIAEAAGAAVSYQPLAENKCIFKCFSNHDLMEDYHAKGL